MIWMDCAPCGTTWRGEHLPCFNCGSAGTGGNGPKFHGSATFTAANVEVEP